MNIVMDFFMKSIFFCRNVVGILLILAFTQQAYSAVVLRAGGEKLNCSTSQYEVPIYGGWSSCFATDYGWIDEYVPRTYSPVRTLREEVRENGYLVTYSCTANIDQIGYDTIENDECSYNPEVQVSVSPVYFRDGDAWATVLVTARSDTATIDTVAWEITSSTIFSGQTSDTGQTGVHEVKLPRPLPSHISAEVTVVDDEGNSVSLDGNLDIIRRTGGR